MPEEIKTSEQRHKLYRHSQLGPCIKCIVTPKIIIISTLIIVLKIWKNCKNKRNIRNYLEFFYIYISSTVFSVIICLFFGIVRTMSGCGQGQNLFRHSATVFLHLTPAGDGISMASSMVAGPFGH